MTNDELKKRVLVNQARVEQPQVVSREARSTKGSKAHKPSNSRWAKAEELLRQELAALR